MWPFSQDVRSSRTLNIPELLLLLIFATHLATSASVLLSTPSTALPLTFTQAVVVALTTVSWTAAASCPAGVIAPRTVRLAGMIQKHVRSLAAQTVRGISLAGGTLRRAGLARTILRKPPWKGREEPMS